MPDIPRYSNFIEHPRYGRSPCFTGLNPHTDYGGDTFLHWHSSKSCRIPNTAIAADLNKQVPATVAVTHYYDVERKCRDCQSMFIFFAAEQKYWYEDLQFGLDSDCVRCCTCRKEQQGLTQKRQQYEELFHVVDRAPDQNLALAECCLYLIEKDVFTSQQTQHVRRLLNQLPNEKKYNERADHLRQQLTDIERSMSNG